MIASLAIGEPAWIRMVGGLAREHAARHKGPGAEPRGSRAAVSVDQQFDFQG
jgi:hypothetical protein